MRQGYTHIITVLDRSGSMDTVRSDTIGGYNLFLEKQQKEPGPATFTLVLFDGGYPDDYIVVYDFAPLAAVPKLTLETYKPRGWTKLYDAIGMTIVREGEKLSAMKEEDRPDTVLMLVMTDGAENRSTEWTAPRLAEIIKQQKEVYNWTITFMGADEKGILQAKSLGVDPGNAQLYAASAEGTQQAFQQMSAGAASLRAQTRRAAASGQAQMRSKDFYSSQPHLICTFINDVCTVCGKQDR